MFRNTSSAKRMLVSRTQDRVFQDIETNETKEISIDCGHKPFLVIAWCIKRHISKRCSYFAMLKQVLSYYRQTFAEYNKNIGFLEREGHHLISNLIIVYISVDNNWKKHLNWSRNVVKCGKLYIPTKFANFVWIFSPSVYKNIQNSQTSQGLDRQPSSDSH